MAPTPPAQLLICLISLPLACFLSPKATYRLISSYYGPRHSLVVCVTVAGVGIAGHETANDMMAPGAKAMVGGAWELPSDSSAVWMAWFTAVFTIRWMSAGARTWLIEKAGRKVDSFPNLHNFTHSFRIANCCVKLLDTCTCTSFDLFSISHLQQHAGGKV